MIGDSYYKAKLQMLQEGMGIEFKEFKVIHETECYAICIQLRDYPIPSVIKLAGEKDLATAKRLHYKTYRIHKDSSRIAFKTKQKAFENLKYLKRKQLHHMQRDIALLSAFNGLAESLSFSGLVAYSQYPSMDHILLVPDTADIVNSHYVFD